MIPPYPLFLIPVIPATRFHFSPLQLEKTEFCEPDWKELSQHPYCLQHSPWRFLIFQPEKKPQLKKAKATYKNSAFMQKQQISTKIFIFFYFSIFIFIFFEEHTKHQLTVCQQQCRISTSKVIEIIISIIINTTNSTATANIEDQHNQCAKKEGFLLKKVLKKHVFNCERKKIIFFSSFLLFFQNYNLVK